MNDYTHEKMIIQQARSAVLPWKSVDACTNINFDRLVDSQAQIEKCLSCTKCDCTNCLHGRKSTYVSKKMLAFQRA